MWTNYLAWCSTETGKKVLFRCGIGVNIVAISLCIAPHTVLLYKYQEIFQMYSGGEGVPLPNYLKQRVNDVINDLNFPKHKRDLIKPFIVYGFNMFHAGSTVFSTGTIIGIPINFTYKTLTDVDHNRMVLAKQTPIDWFRSEAESLLNSLILSEKAQKYAIAFEILKAQTAQPVFNTLSTFFIIGVVQMICTECNNKFKSFLEKSFFRRASLYSLTGLFGIGLWISIKDGLTCFYERRANKLLANLGPDYIEGGHEYCSKLIQKNIAIRTLLNEEGKKLFTSNGNEISFWRQKNLPIVNKKNFFDEKIRSLQVAS